MQPVLVYKEEQIPFIKNYPARYSLAFLENNDVEFFYILNHNTNIESIYNEFVFLKKDENESY